MLSSLRIVSLVLATVAAPAFASSITSSVDLKTLPVTPPAPHAYGIVGDGSVTVGALEFQPYYTGGTMGRAGYRRYINSGIATMVAAVTLPNGVLLRALELDVCDNSTTFAANAALLVVPASGSGITIVSNAFVNTGDVIAPGCGTFSVTLNETVVNASRTYVVELSHGTTSGEISLTSARVRYTRQVSPGPVVATFADVPTTHPLYNFVEALVASGITAGCGNGNYCPDAQLTRGQMAVFLSVALGLHYPD